MIVSQQALRLSTSIIQPLLLLEERFLSRRQDIDAWFAAQWQRTRPPIYGSVDLRNAGFKLAPIDMNLFPAGFNNLNPKLWQHSVAAVARTFQELSVTLHTPISKILIIPEGHTRNLRYWANIKTLQRTLDAAGFETRLGMFEAGLQAEQELALESGESVSLFPLQRQNNRLFVAGFSPDCVLLNNDLSSGIPEILQGLEQPVLPPVELGWSERFKSEHFRNYADVTQEFAANFDLDPWLMTPLFRYCDKVDFMQQAGLECLVANAAPLFAAIERKYEEYQIPYAPFLIIKADAGTYGMAVMTVRSIEELKALNRKQRTRMAMTKGQPVTRVIIQEGVYTFETVGSQQAVAEPVIYLWGKEVVGGFYRVHQKRGNDENLNSPGMEFMPLAFAEACTEPREDMERDACLNRFYAYGIIAKLSMLAAAREIKDV